jgi:hypothetical protein
MTSKRNPRIIFPEGFEDRDAEEMALKGCLSNALVELENGEKYAVDFIEPVRLAQELSGNIKAKIPCYTTETFSHNSNPLTRKVERDESFFTFALVRGTQKPVVLRDAGSTHGVPRQKGGRQS